LPFVPFSGLRIKTKLKKNRWQWFHVEKLTWNTVQNCFETWLSPDSDIEALEYQEVQEALDTYLEAGWWLTNKLSSDLVDLSARESSHCFL